jgi:hypothetical protein
MKAMTVLVGVTLAILTAAPALADSTAEEKYFEALRVRGFDLTKYTPADVGALGQSICDNARDGMSYNTLTQTIQNIGRFNSFETAMLIGNATKIYCPEFAPS